METYTLIVRSKPYLKQVNGKYHVVFVGASKINTEQGKQKEKIQVVRICYCGGSVFSIFPSRKNIERLQAAANGSALEYMKLERHLLTAGKTVIVKGITDETLNQKSIKGMRVSHCEVVVEQATKADNFHLKYGFAEEIEL